MEASSWKNKKVGWFANSALPCGFCFGFAAGLGFAGFGDLRSRWPVVAAAMRKHEKRRTEDQWTGCCRHGLRMSPRNNSWPAFRLTQSLFLNVSFCISVFLFLSTMYSVLYHVFLYFYFLENVTKNNMASLPLLLNRPNEWKLIFFNVILVIYVLFLPFLLLCTMCLFHRVLTYDVWFAADRESSEEKKHMDSNCVFSQNCYLRHECLELGNISSLNIYRRNL